MEKENDPKHVFINSRFGFFAFMQKQFFIFVPLVFWIFLLFHCSIKNPVHTEKVNPEIASPVLSDSVLYVDGDPPLIFSVHVEDPQGLEDIDQVVYQISDSVQVLTQHLMWDDGTRGDLLPKDGRFTGQMTPQMISRRAGNFRIGCVAFDKAGHGSDTVYFHIKAIPGVPNFPPHILRVMIPDTLTTENWTHVVFSAVVQDSNGLTDVDSVYCDIVLPYEMTPKKRIQLDDTGMHGDQMALDGIYTYQGDISEVLIRSGLYRLRFQAKDKQGAKSLPLVRFLSFVIPNRPPVLGNLSAPDTISRNIGKPLTLSIHVEDPEGLGDILRVYFNVTKPNGLPSEGNPFALYDDGDTIQHGDLVAGDGIYSRTIVISPQNDLGVYRFDFYAEDRSGALAGPLTHFITVVDWVLE